jgi:thymidylate synthase (FAD)
MQVKYIQHCGNDLVVANAARVSFNKESEWEFYDIEYDPSGVFYEAYGQRLSDKDTKLINYLAKHQHFSPFNHTFITMHVKAPLFVARQLVKHEYMPWNEVSRRYVDEEPEFYWPETWRARPENGIKQGSGEDLTLDWDPEVHILDALRTYDKLLDSGVAPEMARMVLPQNMYTEWYWSGTLKAWAKMYKLRIDSHAQKETQEIARQVSEIIEPLFPVSWSALKEANFG